MASAKLVVCAVTLLLAVTVSAQYGPYGYPPGDPYGGGFSSLFDILAGSLSSAIDSMTYGPTPPQLQFVYDCQGVLHFAVGGENQMNVVLDSAGLMHEFFQAFQDRLTCACPSLTAAQFDDAFGIVSNAMTLIFGGEKDPAIPGCSGLPVTGWSKWVTGPYSPSPLTPLIDPISTCSKQTWSSSGTCAFTYTYVTGKTPMQVGISKCPNSHIPMVSITAEGTPTPAPIKILCNTNADCDAGSVCQPFTDDNVNSVLQTMGLLNITTDVGKGCKTGLSFLTEVYNKVMGSLFLAGSPVQMSGVCAGSSQSASFTDPKKAVGAWDGKFSNGVAFNAPNRLDGTAPGLANVFGAPYKAAPSANGYTSSMGWACDQLYYYLFPKLGFSFQFPMINLALNGINDALMELQQCRAKVRGGSLSQAQYETRFQVWSPLPWLYQLTTGTSDVNLGPAMGDWLFTLKQNWYYNGQWPLMYVNGGRPLRVTMPSSCTYQNYLTTKRCTLAYKFDSTELASGSVEAVVAIQQCPANTLGPSMAGGVPSMGVFMKSADFNTMGSLCSASAPCGNGYTCMAVDQLMTMNQIDIFGQFLFNGYVGNSCSSSTFPQCCGGSQMLSTVKKVAANIMGQTTQPSENSLSVCIPMKSSWPAEFQANMQSTIDSLGQSFSTGLQSTMNSVSAAVSSGNPIAINFATAPTLTVPSQFESNPLIKGSSVPPSTGPASFTLPTLSLIAGLLVCMAVFL